MDIAASLKNGCQQLGLTVSRNALDQLTSYCRELEKWGRKINLVAMDQTESLIEKHFIDSLLLLTVLDNEAKQKLMDVGTGAGFPGLVLKIARPGLNLTLVEPREKRTSFLRHIIRTLKLEQTAIINKRLEDIPYDSAAEKWPLITSRALNDINAFLEMTAPFAPTGGKVICMKGPKATDEIKLWQKKTHSPFKLQGIKEFRLPRSGAIRNIVLFEKI